MVLRINPADCGRRTGEVLYVFFFFMKTLYPLELSSLSSIALILL